MGQVPDLNGPAKIKRDTLKDILADVEGLVTPQRWVQFANMATSMPIVSGRPTYYHVEVDPIYRSLPSTQVWTQPINTSRATE